MDLFSNLNWAQWSMGLCGAGTIILPLIANSIAKRDTQPSNLATSLLSSGVLLCGISVILLTLISSSIQKSEDMKKDQEAKLLNEDLLNLARENYELTKQAQSEQKNQFVIANAPDPRIVTSSADEGKTYNFVVKNFGNSTAENLKLVLDYSYAPLITIGVKELPPGAHYIFTSDMYPFETSLPMAEMYKETKAKLIDGSSALVVHIAVQHDWQGKTDTTSEYTLIYDGKKLILW